MSLKGLENAIRNLNSLDRHMVPQASAWAVNRVAASAVSAATHRVAKEAVAGDNQKKRDPFPAGETARQTLEGERNGKTLCPYPG